MCGKPPAFRSQPRCSFLRVSRLPPRHSEKIKKRHSSVRQSLTAHQAAKPRLRSPVARFQLFFHSLKKTLNRFVDSSLQSVAEARLAHQPHTGMKIPGAFSAQFNVMRNIYHSGAVLFFKLQGIAQKV